MEGMVAMTTRCTAVPSREVTQDQADAMWSMFQSTYKGVDRSVFEYDYRVKDMVIQLWEGEKLAGFTSLVFKNIDTRIVAYSGDIVIAPWARGIATIVFFRVWAEEVLRKADWWCSLTSGVRTYRILHTFFKRITPFAGVEETEEETRNRDLFTTRMYGNEYDAAAGIVRLKNPYTLRNDTRPPSIDDPIDAYFIHANPGWIKGDELVSLVRMSSGNLKPAALRVLKW